jgi:hypothetical protein
MLKPPPLHQSRHEMVREILKQIERLGFIQDVHFGAENGSRVRNITRITREDWTILEWAQLDVPITPRYDFRTNPELGYRE